MSFNIESNLKEYSVIEFLEDGGVSVIPSHWLSETKDTCKFPSPVPKNFDKVLAIASSPVESTWIDYPVTLIKSYSKYISYIIFNFK